MKIKFLWTLLTTLLIASSMYAQRPIPENTMVSETALFEREYPRVDKQKRGYFRLYAPKAQEVYLVCGKRYDMTKDNDGWWYVTTSPLVVGLHFYHYMVDGMTVTDIETYTYGGSYGRSSAIEGDGAWTNSFGGLLFYRGETISSVSCLYTSGVRDFGKETLSGALPATWYVRRRDKLVDER